MGPCVQVTKTEIGAERVRAVRAQVCREALASIFTHNSLNMCALQVLVGIHRATDRMFEKSVVGVCA
jgi:hypothetical protein